MELLRSLLVFRLLHVIARCCLRLASTQYTKLFFANAFFSQEITEQENNCCKSICPRLQKHCVIVFSTSFGEELGRSAPTCFIFVNPCVFGWMFHVKEMKLWHAVEACRSFFPELSPPLFQFGALLGHLLASFQKKSRVITLHCFVCLC